MSRSRCIRSKAGAALAYIMTADAARIAREQKSGSGALRRLMAGTRYAQASASPARLRRIRHLKRAALRGHDD